MMKNALLFKCHESEQTLNFDYKNKTVVCLNSCVISNSLTGHETNINDTNKNYI